VRTSDVEAWIAELAADCSPSIVRRCHGMLHGILATAVKDQLVARNAAAGVALPRKVPKPRAYLTHVQVDAVASAADTDEHALLVRFLAYTGLRWGEMAALRVRNLDMLRRRVNVEQSVVVLKKREEAFTTPKTYERRSVPFPKFLATALAKQCEGRGRDSLLFGDGENALRTLHSQRSWLKAAIRGANEHGTTVPDFSPHSLRHTAASLAISAGASPKAVQRMLGHSSAAMTLDTYADLFEDDLDAVAAALDAARESKCGQKVGKAPAANKTKAPTPA
jgi:integrase